MFYDKIDQEKNWIKNQSSWRSFWLTKRVEIAFDQVIKNYDWWINFKHAWIIQNKKSYDINRKEV